MRTSRRLSPAIAVVVLCACATALEAVATDQSFSVTAEDVLEATRGRPFVRVVTSDDPTEVVTIAGTLLGADADEILRCASEPGCLRQREECSSGRVSLRPRAEEFDGVGLDERDLEELGRCRIGACDLRLPAEAIRQMGREIDWSMAPAAAAARFRSFLHSRASAYRADGHAALTPYSDRADGNQPARGLELLLGRPIPGLDAAPDIRAYLRDGRRPRPSGIVDEYLAWFRERFFRKSVVSLEHVVVARRDTPDEERVLVVAKKIYASHYFEASVEALEFAKPRGALDGRLVVAARSRTDIRRSGFNWIERLLLRRTVRGRITTELTQTRRHIESRSGSLPREVGARISSVQ